MKLSSEKKRIVLNNQKLVYHLVKKLGITPNSSDYEDIISIGTIGLIKATISFDPSHKNTFSTYAAKCIKNEIFQHYRKTNKYAYDISIYEPIENDENDLTLLERIEDSKANFIEEIINRESFIQSVNIILNCLKGKSRIVILYWLGNVSEQYIAKKLNISQSYVSRIKKKASRKIREIDNYQINYKEVFSMTIVENEYNISFSSRDISRFNQIFATLLQNITSTETLPNFRVNCNKERIIIRMPQCQESFSFIAQIIQEIDNFSITFVSDDTNKKASDVISHSNIVNKTNVESSIVKRNSQVKQLKDYILSMDSFSVKDLKHHFPNMTPVAISNVIYSIKKKGLITATERGKYVVNKDF